MDVGGDKAIELTLHVVIVHLPKGVGWQWCCGAIDVLEQSKISTHGHKKSEPFGNIVIY